MENLVVLAATNKYKCYFLGAHQSTVEKVVDIYISKYGREIIGGFRDGFFSESSEKEIAQKISESGAHILFVAMNSPKKENFIHRHSKVLKNVNFIMGVGGSFDVVAGVTKRAPEFMQKNGLEWLFRFLQEPRRMWKRYLIGNFHFVFLIVKEKIKQYKLI